MLIKKGDRAGCGDVSTVYEAISLHMCLSYQIKLEWPFWFYTTSLQKKGFAGALDVKLKGE
jgi:hypothetical protein